MGSVNTARVEAGGSWPSGWFPVAQGSCPSAGSLLPSPPTPRDREPPQRGLVLSSARLLDALHRPATSSPLPLSPTAVSEAKRPVSRPSSLCPPPDPHPSPPTPVTRLPRADPLQGRVTHPAPSPLSCCCECLRGLPFVRPRKANQCGSGGQGLPDLRSALALWTPLYSLCPATVLFPDRFLFSVLYLCLCCGVNGKARARVFFSAVWVPEVELRSSGLVANTPTC